MTELEKTLLDAIRQCGMSLCELARRSDVAVPSISRFANGERGLNLTVAGKLCRALGLSLFQKKRRP